MEFIDSFSIHDVPMTNTRAAIVTKTDNVFREQENICTSRVNGVEYVTWGAADDMPYKLIDLIESDETLSTCQMFNAEVCYGSGLRYCTAEASADVRNQVEDFLLDNPMADYFLGVCQDIKHFNFAVSVIILNGAGNKIVELHRKEACYCRFTPIDPKTGKIGKVLYGNFRNLGVNDEVEQIDLLDVRAPWSDLKRRLANGSKCRKFAILTRFPGVDSLYYPIPHYAALFKGNWYNIKRLIGEAKLAKLKNAAPIRYLIEVSQNYWINLFRDLGLTSAEAQRKAMDEKKAEMISFLTSVENSGAVLFSPKSLNMSGNGETSDITVTSIDSKTKEGGDWESDIAEAVNMICFTMRVHSNLVGSVPGKSQSNNSGSDKRELYTIAHALQKPYHDLMLQVHNLIIRFNGWDGVHPDCPFVMLTTLDKHTDAQEVTNSNE